MSDATKSLKLRPLYAFINEGIELFKDILVKQFLANRVVFLVGLNSLNRLLRIPGIKLPLRYQAHGLFINLKRMVRILGTLTHPDPGSQDRD